MATTASVTNSHIDMIETIQHPSRAGKNCITCCRIMCNIYVLIVAVLAGKRSVDVLAMTYSQHALIGSGGYFPEDVKDVITVMVSKNGV